jgi:hypothetical protein
MIPHHSSRWAYLLLNKSKQDGAVVVEMEVPSRGMLGVARQCTRKDIFVCLQHFMLISSKLFETEILEFELKVHVIS